jgi:hypothetical protein
MPTSAMATTGFADEPTDAQRSEPSSGGATAPQTSASNSATAFDQLIVRTAQLTLRVSNVGDALGWVRTIAGARGGLVFSSSSYVQDDSQYAQVTIKVPTAVFDDVMNELRGGPLVDEVEREDVTSQDVTGEYVDNDSLLASLRETQTRFLALLDKADTVDDILRLEYELTNVRSQIETLQGRQNYLKDATSLATIAVSLYPTGAAEPAVADEGGFSIEHVASTAWEHSRAIVEGALTVVLTALILGLTFLPFALVGWLVARFVRGRRRRSAAPVADGA